MQLKVQLDSHSNRFSPLEAGPLTACQLLAVLCCRAEKVVHDVCNSVLTILPMSGRNCLKGLLRLSLCPRCSLQHLGWLLCKAEWMGVPSSNPAVGAAFTICELQRRATSPRSRPETH